ncbi:putative membrane protein [Blastococcus colisei]|uniref:Putative membrane protein n=1 Tax=Blastococcus colisei TaxID=1564162 RepID=A0A543P0Q4_9ACTN|nr:DUF202 domain-containing protein [Blastococcus colisei]TQN37651.1 putative membrane protein [Blastococcus colisei]
MSSPVETQPERTALAWQRTGLGVLAVAALIAHGAVRESRPAALIAAGIAALLGLGVLGGLGPLRYRRLVAGPRTAVPGLVRTATGATVLVAVVAAVVVVTQR